MERLNVLQEMPGNISIAMIPIMVGIWVIMIVAMHIATVITAGITMRTADTACLRKTVPAVVDMRMSVMSIADIPVEIIKAAGKDIITVIMDVVDRLFEVFRLEHLVFLFISVKFPIDFR